MLWAARGRFARICVLAGVAGALVVLVSGAGAANVVPNPGFEAACGKAPCDWSPTGAGQIVRDVGTVHQGSASMRVDATDFQDGASTCVTNVTSPAGTYTMSIWWSTNDADVNGVDYSAQPFSSTNCTGSPLGSASQLSGTAPTKGWQQLSGPAALPSGTGSVRLSVDVRCVVVGLAEAALQACSTLNAATAWFDDAALQLPDCSDGQDNDGDGLTDYPNDPGCSSASDTSELNPTLSIGDVTVLEGNAGSTDATFAVTRSGQGDETVSVAFSTADGTATAPSDYEPASGTLTFAPNETQKTITVHVLGDTVVEPDETFAVNLSSPTFATISDSQGLGTIVNDDGSPTLSIADSSVVEGNSGTTTASFAVTLSPASQSPVTTAYATSDGTARAPGDYTSTSGTLNFAPGQTQQTIQVPVVGDTDPESDETFTVQLSGATNATIGRGSAVGTITNDDPQTSTDVEVVNTGPGEEELPPEQAIVQVQVTRADGGRVVTASTAGRRSARAGADLGQINCGAGTYHCYSTVTPGLRISLRARPRPGYRLAGWTGPCSNQSLLCTITALKAAVVGATFVSKHRPPRISFQVGHIGLRAFRWKQSAGQVTLAVGGRVSRGARIRFELRRPRGAPVLTRTRRGGPGLFQFGVRVHNPLARHARVLPGGYVAVVRGSAGGVALPAQIRPFTLPAPREGVVRESYLSTSHDGPPVRAPLPAGKTKQAWVTFVFEAQPRTGPIVARWTQVQPRSQSLGPDVKMSNRPEITTGIGASGGLPSGTWRVVLIAGGRPVATRDVKVR